MKKIVSLIIVLFASTLYAGFPSSYTGLTGLWRFTDSSNSVIDVTGQNSNGTIHGSPIFANGGIDFGGQGVGNTCYITVPHNPIQSSHSVTFIIRKRLTRDMVYQQSTQIEKAWNSDGSGNVFGYIFGLTYTPDYSPHPLQRTLNWCITNTHDLITNDFLFPADSQFHTLICSFDYASGIARMWLDTNHFCSQTLGSIDITGATGDLIFGSQLFYGGQDWGDYDETLEIALLNYAVTTDGEVATINGFYGGASVHFAIQNVKLQNVKIQ